MEIVTQADVDRALAEGRKAGHAEGRAEGHTAGHAEGLEVGRAEGAKSGADAERARIKGILGCEEAKGRQASALFLATATAMSVDEAKGALAGLEKPKAGADHPSGRGPLGIVLDKDPGRPADAKASWDDIVAAQNAKMKSRGG